MGPTQEGGEPGPAHQRQGVLMQGYKRWRGGVLIPDQHEPGKQNGYKEGKKHQGSKNPKSEHSSKTIGGVIYWGIGRWAGGAVK